MHSVFIVDDDALILEEIIDTVPWLDNAFEVVGSATDPVKALEEIKEFKPDVVFCDLKMPVLSGNELIKKAREEGVESEFVMLSAYDDYDNVRTFFKNNGFDYILKPIDNDEIQIVLNKLDAKLSRKKPLEETGDEGKNADESLTKNPVFNNIMLYISVHFADKITLESLAEEFGYSRNYICKLFQKNLNKSLNLYVTELRMKQAVELLKDDDVLIKEVAYKIGYNDYYHFFKVFKEHYGISPKEMREGTLEN